MTTRCLDFICNLKMMDLCGMYVLDLDCSFFFFSSIVD